VEVDAGGSGGTGDGEEMPAAVDDGAAEENIVAAARVSSGG
jgi:hypothetical protein